MTVLFQHYLKFPWVRTIRAYTAGQFWIMNSICISYWSTQKYKSPTTACCSAPRRMWEPRDSTSKWNYIGLFACQCFLPSPSGSGQSQAILMYVTINIKVNGASKRLYHLQTSTLPLHFSACTAQQSALNILSHTCQVTWKAETKSLQKIWQSSPYGSALLCVNVFTGLKEQFCSASDYNKLLNMIYQML